MRRAGFTAMNNPQLSSHPRHVPM